MRSHVQVVVRQLIPVTPAAPHVWRHAETAVDWLRGSSAALIARRNPLPLAAFDAAFDGYEAEIAALRREGLLHDLPGDAVERFFALGFALEQLHLDFRDLGQCVSEYARSAMGTSRKGTN
jgi:hypothetical protein